MSLQPSPKRTPESCSVLVNAALVAYLPKPKTDKRKNLWSKNEEESVQEATEVLLESTTEEDEEAPPDWISFWKPNMTVNLVDDFTKYTLHTRSLARVFAATLALFLILLVLVNYICNFCFCYQLQ
jgi:hypothetical protein